MATAKKIKIIFPERINIHGSDYKVQIKRYNEDPHFEKMNCSGYCDGMQKIIVIGDLTTFKEYAEEAKEYIETSVKLTLRHEILHAFFNESGLMTSTNPCLTAWAENEEMVDWFALQGSKIFKLWSDLNLIDISQ